MPLSVMWQEVFVVVILKPLLPIMARALTGWEDV